MALVADDLVSRSPPGQCVVWRSAARQRRSPTRRQGRATPAPRSSGIHPRYSPAPGDQLGYRPGARHARPQCRQRRHRGRRGMTQRAVRRPLPTTVTCTHPRPGRRRGGSRGHPRLGDHGCRARPARDRPRASRLTKPARPGTSGRTHHRSAPDEQGHRVIASPFPMKVPRHLWDETMCYYATSSDLQCPTTPCLAPARSKLCRNPS
jgi:hypothetical protein